MASTIRTPSSTATLGIALGASQSASRAASSTPARDATEEAKVEEEIPPTEDPPTPTSTTTATSMATATESPTATATASMTLEAAQQGVNQDLISAGLQVYKEQYCGVCHQLGTVGSGGLFGPTHNAMGATAAQRIHGSEYDGDATTAEDYLWESIVQPKAFLVPGYEHSNHAMPAYTGLSDEQIMALVQMLLAEQ